MTNAATYTMMDDESLTDFVGMTWRPEASVQAACKALIELYLTSRSSLNDTEDLHWFLCYELVSMDLCNGHDVQDLAIVAMLDAYSL